MIYGIRKISISFHLFNLFKLMQLSSLERKQKLLLGFPLLILPFLGLAFYSLGGGASTDVAALDTTHRGLNWQLPALKMEQSFDKLALYQKARLDSIERIKGKAASDSTLEAKPGFAGPSQQQQMLRSLEKLEALTQKKPAYRPEPAYDFALPTLSVSPASTPEKDPQLEQLHALLDKVLAVQKAQTTSDTGRSEVGPVQTGSGQEGSGFWGLSQTNEENLEARLTAVVTQNQIIKNGSLLSLQVAKVSNLKLTPGQLITGHVKIQDQRLFIEIREPGYTLQAYEQEAVRGLSIDLPTKPTSLLNPASRLSQQLMMAAVEPGLPAQLAQTGLETARSLLRSTPPGLRLDKGHQLFFKVSPNP